jgi:hypothetical protein
MSSSAFSFDDFDAALASVTATPPSSTTVPTLSTVPSGVPLSSSAPGLAFALAPGGGRLSTISGTGQGNTVPSSDTTPSVGVSVPVSSAPAGSAFAPGGRLSTFSGGPTASGIVPGVPVLPPEPGHAIAPGGRLSAVLGGSVSSVPSPGTAVSVLSASGMHGSSPSTVFPGSRLSAASASVSSGESNLFTMLGSALVAGGVGGSGKKRVGLLVSPHASDYCMGLINTTKFCTRKVGTCVVATHASKKFHSEDFMGYVRDTDIRAWCQPALDVSSLNRAQVNRLQEIQLSVAEWIELFHQLKLGSTPKWLDIGEMGDVKQSDGLLVDTTADAGADLMSPFAHAQNGGLLNLIPALSFDDSVDSTTPDFSAEDLDPSEIAAYIGKFRANFHSLKQKWMRAFMEIESSYGMVVNDLQKLNQLSTNHQQEIGLKPDQESSTNSTLWSNIYALKTSVFSVSNSVAGHDSALGELYNNQTSLAQVVTTLEDSTDQISTSLGTKVLFIERDVRAVEQRLLKLLPLLTQLRQARVPAPDQPSQVQDQLDALTRRVQELHELVYDQVLVGAAPMGPSPSTSTPAAGGPVLIPDSPGPLTGSSSPVSLHEVMSQLLTVQTEMKQLQLRVVGKGVQIANRTFQTFDEVKLWVTTNLPNRRYGLFVDGVSIFEFFTHGHIDAETTYSAFYSQHKTGFQSSFEARVASSIQNLFPTIFGKTASNVDTAEALPALRSPEKWDSNDGNTGLRYQITRNMADVEFQIQETISSVLGPYTEAKHIAQECLHHSKRFALELTQFITSDYQKWRHRGHAQKDAWKMTSVCVRRIFEELYSERVVARDVYDQKDPDFTTAKYLWATWKAHAVMDKYLRHQFYEHPAISAVLARHLADNYVKPDDSQNSKIKVLESRVNSLDTSLSTLQSKYDTLRVAAQNKEKEHVTPSPQKDNNNNYQKDKAKNWKGTPTPGSG